MNGSSVEAKIAFDKAVGIGMAVEEFEIKVARAFKASFCCILRRVQSGLTGK